MIKRVRDASKKNGSGTRAAASYAHSRMVFKTGSAPSRIVPAVETTPRRDKINYISDERRKGTYRTLWNPFSRIQKSAHLLSLLNDTPG
jgi:hypothetical protein